MRLRDMIKMRSIFALSIVMLFFGVSVAGASVITEAQYNSVLFAWEYSEDFEAPAIGSGAAVDTQENSIDSTTVITPAPFSGTSGWVNDAMTFSTDSPGTLYWLGESYFGLPDSQAMTTDGERYSMYIDFSVDSEAPDFVQYFGIDLAYYPGYEETATISLFDLDDNLIFTSDEINLTSEYEFFGYEYMSGISRVAITGTGEFGSPIIDNVRIGAVPLPAAIWLLGSGLLGLFGLRRRKS